MNVMATWCALSFVIRAALNRSARKKSLRMTFFVNCGENYPLIIHPRDVVCVRKDENVFFPYCTKSSVLRKERTKLSYIRLFWLRTIPT